MWGESAEGLMSTVIFHSITYFWPSYLIVWRSLLAWDTSISTHLLSGIIVLPYALLTGMSGVSLLILIPQLERDCGTAPHPPDWYVWRISLDSYPAKFWVVFYVRGIRLLPSRELPNNLLFFYSQLISKEVTPMILRQIVSCIAHDRPWCHLITFGSYCSAIFILTTLTGKSISKIF